MAGGTEQHPHHFTLFGFPVHVGWQFFVWPVFIALDRSPIGLVTWIVVVFLSVLLHELGHAVAFRAFGSGAWIRLWGLGGLTYGRTPNSRWKDAVVSLAGPVPPLLLIGLPAYLAYRSGVGGDNLDLRQALLDIWWANLFWSVVNLLPILPMDGGRLVESLAGHGPARVTSVLSGLGAGAFFLVVMDDAFLFVVGLAIAGYNLYALVQARNAGIDLRATRWRRSRARADDAPVRRDPPSADAAWAALDRGDLDAASAMAGRLGPAAPHLLTGALLAASSQPDAALPFLTTGLVLGEPAPPVLDRLLVESGLLLPVVDAVASSGAEGRHDILAATHARLRDRGHLAAAAEVGARGAAVAPEPGPAWYDVARTWARARDVERTVGALRESARHGHATGARVTADPAFTRLWDDPRFPPAVGSLSGT